MDERWVHGEKQGDETEIVSCVAIISCRTVAAVGVVVEHIHAPS